MPESLVRQTDAIFPAVHLSDTDWEEVVGSWMTKREVPAEQQEEFLGNLREKIREAEVVPWLVANEMGVAPVHPADFARDFEDVNATPVLDEIWHERRRQFDKGYTSAHDDVHGLSHLLLEAGARIEQHATGYTEGARADLVKAAALAVAAIDLIDRGESISVKKIPAEHTEEEQADFGGFEDH